MQTIYCLTGRRFARGWDYGVQETTQTTYEHRDAETSGVRGMFEVGLTN